MRCGEPVSQSVTLSASATGGTATVTVNTTAANAGMLGDDRERVGNLPTQSAVRGGNDH